MVSPSPMRTPTKKRPSMEMEPGEGKAHEMKESPEEEVREGTESEEGEQYRKPSRKRSAKGAKRTKAPMDCEGCSGKGKCKACSGKAMKDGCGSYPMKKRSDALTTSEYLAACKLGIQDRPRTYIRGRLDALERLDLKCGNGAISQGEKCHVGPAKRVQAAGPSVGGRISNALESTAMTVGKVGGMVNNVTIAKAAFSGNYKELSRGLARAGALTALEGTGQYARGARTGSAYLRRAGANKMQAGIAGAAVSSYFAGDLNKAMLTNASARGRRMAQNTFGTMSAKKSNVTKAKQKQQAWRGYERSLLDSAWADGFSVDVNELRVDLKCGNGAISQGEKCHVGPAQRMQPANPRQELRAQRKAEKQIVRGYQKLSTNQLNEQYGRLNKELNTHLENKFGKRPVRTQEELNEFLDIATQAPQWKEMQHVSKAYTNKRRNQSIRRTAAAMVLTPLAVTGAAAALSRGR